MALDTNFNVNPYYDDYDEDKKFLRVLFKPGYAVQARELTQLQTILQKQSERFGSASYKNGSIVTGASTFTQNATYIKLNSSYLGTDIIANNFIGMTILSNDDSKRAEVIKVYEANIGTGDPITLMVKQLYGDAFIPADVIKTNENSPYYGEIATSGVGTGQTFSVTEGVFYYDGFFIKNDEQTIAISKYDNTSANARIGFEITESIVKSSTDTSLLDPAQDASNYQAPGADRFKIDLILSSRALDSTDTTKFIELCRVVNGQIIRTADTGVAAIVEDTLARRTYDESGNYTVSPFILSLETNSANSANMDVILSPGKAYVYGYEYGTTSPTTITVEKPRTTSNVNNRRITGDYGNYIYTTGHIGSWPIDQLSTVDLHCVPNASINVTSTATISNSKIGTARVKSIAFDSSSNTSNVVTYTYKTFLFDINVNSSITGNVNAASVTSTTIPIGNVTAGQVYSTVPDAYKGAKLRITTGPGAGESPKFITGFTGTTSSQNLTIASAFTATLNSQSKFSIDFEFNDADSLATFSSTTKINAATIDTRSKDTTSTYVDTIATDSYLEPLIFPVGQQYVTPGTIADFTYTQRRLYQNVAFSGTGTTVESAALSTYSGESLSTASGSSAILEKYHVVVTSIGTSPYVQYQTVPVANITAVNTTTKKLTVAYANNMTANIIATIDYTLASGSPAKSKTLVNESSTIQTSGGEVINSSGVIVYSSSGQTTIQANNIIRTPDTLQSLYVPDVIQLISVYDFNGASIANTGYTDVTSRYTLETGQKDSFYDHSSIKLKAGFSAPIGPIVVRYKAFSSSGAGFFSADSYPTYGTIPSYLSISSGVQYNLRDCLDFRPVRKAATAAIGTTVVFDVDPTSTGPKIPKYGSDIILDYSYYLPRIDKVVLNKNKYFEIIKGEPAINPIIPKDKDDTMNLYLLAEPAYIANTSEIVVSYFNNRRYTMKDIGALDTRISNLEYYTSLSLLEQDAINKQDATTNYSSNLQRFKNGIVVDSFKGHSVADVTALDYKASIDVKEQELRPTFNITSRMLNFDASNSTSYLQSGPFVTVPASNTSFVNQALASRTMNINPFNVVNYIGKITLNPPSDIWVDTTKKPDVTVNLGGDKDAWALIDEVVNNSAFTYEWGSWQTVWSGSTTSVSDNIRGDAWTDGPRAGRGNIRTTGTRTTTTTTTNSQTRTGVKSQIVPETITKSIGDRVVDVSIIPYMRAKSVLFVASDFKPDTILYPFFDGTAVEKYTVRANKFILAKNNLGYRTATANGESVTVYNNGTSSSIGSGVVVKSSNNSVFVVNLNPTSAFNVASANLIGASTSTSVRISGYEHYSGFANTATTTTIKLAIDATGANNEVLYGNTSNSNIISIVAGTGAGQQRTISSYVAATRIATVSSVWSTTPDTTSVYSIGRLTSTRSGDVVGIFNIPASTFRVGEKQFRLIDSSTGDIPSSSTNGDASFYAQGLLETTENTIVSTIQPTIQRTSVIDRQVTTTTSSITTPLQGWYDPLAQSFLISPAQYSQGMFLEKVRVCFKTKHDTAPITLQLRPTVNGYPSSTVIYPYGTVTLTPDQVNVSDSPSLDDATKYTDFVFDTPIYMLPGEHTFVLVSNSNGYEAYVAEIGKLDLVSGLQISEQPYGGSLFKSQNGSTWTADENMDMMFRLFRKEFSTSQSTLQFLVDKPSSNVVFDLLNLTTSEIAFANTSVSYSFLSEKSSGGTTDYYNINPSEDYAMTDINGRRVLNPTSGNNTFILKATMSTTNPHISPIIDTTRYGGLFVENIINALPLLNTGFAITTSGSGYTGNTAVTISGGGGSGANAYAVANVTTGNITSIIVDVGGSGYTTSPTITINAPPVTSGNTTAVVSYNGEDKKSGGNSVTRYMMRRVTLADGFDSGDLRVYLTGYKPSGSNIYVYYKILSKSDSDTFDTKNYQLMTEIGNGNFISLTKNDYRELTFAPGISGAANNSVTYTTDTSSFNSFKTFAIKIVMSGTNTTDVPKVRDVRAIALPAA
jgi:hypothetical protein